MDLTTARKANNTDEYMNDIAGDAWSNTFSNILGWLGLDKNADRAYQNATAKDQYARELSFEGDKWAANVEGMQAAGINPAMAASNLGSGTAGLASPSAPDSGGKGMQALTAAMLKAQTRNSEKLTEAKVRNMNANTALMKSKLEQAKKIIKFIK